MTTFMGLTLPSVSLRIESQTSLSGTYGKNGRYSWFLIEEIQRF